jgi:glycosyltransferase involved in cell wall biosynthesis
VIPAFNEEHAIGLTVAEYKKSFPDATIVVIDNNSVDKTGEVARQALDPTTDHLLVERRQGKGSAVEAGLSRIAADIYIMTDGDGTYPAEDAKRLVTLLLDHRCDMVVGDRVSGGTYQKQNKRAGHSFGNRILTAYVSFLAGQKYSDVLSGLRVMSRPFVNMLDVRSSGFQLETELNVLAAYLRANIIEEPIAYLERPEGSVSKLNTVRDGFRILRFALLNWVAFYPLHALGAVAALALLISAALGIFVFVVFFELGYMPYPATAVAAAAAGIVGLQSFFTGLGLRIIGRGTRRRDVAHLIEMRRDWNTRLDA